MTNFFYVRKVSLSVIIAFTFTTICYGQAPTITSFTPPTVTTGAVVYIQGTNFTGATSVQFGGVEAASFFVYGPTFMQAQVSNGASGSITVTTPFGTATKTGFTYLPPATMTSFSPFTGGVGTTITIEGTNFTNVLEVLFGNEPASSFTIVSPTTITAIAGPGSSGDVQVVTTHGSPSLPGFIHTGPAIHSFSPTAGVTGTIITLTGENFIGVISVTIGGIPVTSFNVISSTSMTAETAAGSSGNIVVSTPNGSSNAAGFNKTVIKSFNPQNNTIGSTVNIKGLNLSNAISVSFGGIPAASFTQSGDTSITAIVGMGANGAVKVVTSYGADSMYFFTFSLPVPLISSFSPAIGGPGTIITIKGRYFTGTSAVKFGNTNANSFTAISDSVITAVVGNGSTGDVSVIGTYGTHLKPGFTYTIAPTIFSVTPLSGPAGTVISIRGVNFGANADANSVYFGPVKAPVLTSSDIAITAIIPPGGGYDFIRVTANNLTASSAKPFIMTFPGDTSFTLNSFDTAINMVTSNARKPYPGDFDRDGKPDIVMIHSYNDDSTYITIHKNTGTNGSVSFAPEIKIFFRGFPKKISINDMDGDGRLDIVISRGSSFDVIKNTSTGGNLSFDPPLFIPLTDGGHTAYIHGLAVEDFDKDGKPDVVFTNDWDAEIFVMKNTSANGVISFVNVYNFSNTGVVAWPENVVTEDLDGDGRIDMVVNFRLSASNPPGRVLIYRNTSTSPGDIKFTGTYHYFDQDLSGISVGDLDADGKPDLVFTVALTNKVYVLKNISQVSAILFAPKMELTLSSALTSMAIGDMNGDGKPDLVGAHGEIFKNLSTNGTISFSPPFKYVPDGAFAGVTLNDIDMDGRPDIMCSGYFSPTMLVLRNNTGPGIVYLCPPASSGSIVSTVQGNTYQWQSDTGNGFADITDNSNYAGTNSATLQLNEISSSWYGYKYRCVIDGNIYSAPQEIKFRNIWTGAVSSAWDNPANWSCGTVPDDNTDVFITTGTVVINTSIIIRRLTLSPAVNVTVTPGTVVTITH